MQSNSARKLANQLLVLRVILKEFRELFVLLAWVFGISCAILYLFYPRADLPHGQLTILQTAYVTLLMMFFNNPLPWVDHVLVSPLFFILPIIGLVVVADGVVNLGNLLFQHKRYSREWQKMIASSLKDHIIVCGLGNVGVRVVQHLLKLDELVVAIEANANARFIKEVEAMEVPVLIGDARDSGMQESGNVKYAKAIVAVTDNDMANLESVLTARESNPDIRVVIRMFDQKLAKKIQNSLGIGAAYSSSARSSRLFAQAAISENILDSFEFGGTTINAYQLAVETGSSIAGATVDDIRRKHEVTVLLQEKQSGELDWNPSPENVLSVGDKLLIMTDREGIKRLQNGHLKVKA